MKTVSQSLRGGGRIEVLCILAMQRIGLGWAALASPRSWLEPQDLWLHPDFLNQNQHFHKILRGFSCALMFKKYCLTFLNVTIQNTETLWALILHWQGLDLCQAHSRHSSICEVNWVVMKKGKEKYCTATQSNFWQPWKGRKEKSSFKVKMIASRPFG